MSHVYRPLKPGCDSSGSPRIIPDGMHLEQLSVKEWTDHLVRRCHESQGELHEKVNVNHFWLELMSALESDIFGRTAPERRRLFRVDEDKVGPFAPIPDYQLKAGEEQSEKRWVSKLLHIYIEAVLDKMRAWKRQMGILVQLDINDLRAQMKTRPYWVAGKDGHTQRFEGITKRCISIKLDFHELGYQAAAPAAWNLSLHPDGDPAVFVERVKWKDPRRGILFGVEDALSPRKPSDDNQE